MRYHLSPLYRHVRQNYLLNKWKKHSFQNSFDWNWKAENYNRIALVNLLRSGKPDGNYLEIGCDENAVFDSVPAKYKVGVDPEKGGTLRMTSDDFFLSNKQKFDVIFIDGLHIYEQVRKDVINSINCINDGGWIALHDMLPRNWIEEHVPIISLGDWNGDVWKVAFELANTDGIDFKLLKIDRGVGVIRMSRPNVKLTDLRKKLDHERFEYLYANLSKLPLASWEEAYDWIKTSRHS